MESLAPSASFDRSNRLGSSTQDFRTFSEYSEFLRAAMADEESLQLRDGLHFLAGQIEQISLLLRALPVDHKSIALDLTELLDLLRAYSQLVQDMGEDWHVSEEFKAHFRALTHFRNLVLVWTSEAGLPLEKAPEQTEFDLAAWRLLGAGVLLLDAFEQAGPRSALPGETELPEEPSWWGRLLTVLHFKA